MPDAQTVKNLPLPDLLLGTYEPKLDTKGRIAIPAKMRTQLGAGCVMARGQERCVYLLPNDEFRRIAQQIQQVSLSNRAARNYLRVFLSGAVVLEPDKQGRVMIPQMLRTYANLTDDVVLIGVGTRAELWNRDDWNTYLHNQEEDYSTMSDDILPVEPLMGGLTGEQQGVGLGGQLADPMGGLSW